MIRGEVSNEAGESRAGAAGALRFLRSNRPFQLLWFARAISFLGDAIRMVALLLYTANTTGQAFAVALLLLADDFVPAMMSPLIGVISDRFDRKRVMVICELVQGALVAVIALTLPPLPWLVALVAARAVVGHVFQSASRAAIPALVQDRDLESANSALGFGMNCSEALGPLVAAAFLPIMDVRGVLLVDAITFVVGAMLLAFLPSQSSDRPEAGAQSSFLAEAKAGLGYIWSVPTLRAIGLGFCGVVAFNGIDDVALVFLAKTLPHGGDSAVSAVYAAVGVGLLVGYALLARYAGYVRMTVLLLVGFAVSSAGNLLSGLAWSVAAAFTMQTIRGVGISGMDVGSNTLIQRLVPAAMLGRVFGNLYGAIGIAAGLSYVFGGLLLQLTSPRLTFIIAGTGGLLVTFACALALRSTTRARPAHTTTPAGQAGIE
jgi:MFS family permease